MALHSSDWLGCFPCGFPSTCCIETAGRECSTGACRDWSGSSNYQGCSAWECSM